MKFSLSLLLYTSLGFLLLFLYYFDYIEIPVIQNHFLFVTSVFFVLLGYLLESKVWHLALKNNIFDITFKDAVISNGSFIFTKYIPGKLWVIIGKAGYIKEKYKGSFVDLSSFSFFNLLISLTAGAIVGFSVFYLIDKSIFVIASLVVIAGVLYLFWGYKWFLSFTSALLTKIFRKPIKLPDVGRKTTLHMLLVSVGIWLLWSVGFYLMLLSLESSQCVSVLSGLVFPVSAIFGVVVVFAPGGLGFREGLIAFGLTALGLPAAEAASFAVVSRLWFLCGEALFFLTARLSKKFTS